MAFKVTDDLVVGEVSEVHGAKLKVRIYGEANEAHIFYRGDLVKGVSVGGYVKIPCGYDSVIGIIEGDYQEESGLARDDTSSRVVPCHCIERFVDISVFGVMNENGFDRGISALPLVKSKVYLLAPDELGIINSPVAPEEPVFPVGALAGHNGTPVRLPANALFASHIGIFGNTGSGKSNTLCKIYSDCFEMIDRGAGLGKIESKFVFIDFNGEYVGDETLTASKSVYQLNTRAKGDKVPVPKGFYSDVDIWSILTKATEKTQRPFLSRCIRKADSVRSKGNPSAYLEGILVTFLKGYCGNALLFGDQKADLARLISLALNQKTYKNAGDTATDSLETLQVFPQSPPIVRSTDNNAYLNTEADTSKVFAGCLNLDFDYESLVVDTPRLLAFIALLRYLEQWRGGRIVREHIAPWVNRYIAELQDSSKLYELGSSDMLEEIKQPVAVFSLLKVNQDQKRVIPLVIAKYLYEEQKRRGQDDLDSSVHLIIDEAHNILSYSSQRESESWRDYRLETFEEIVKEGRKFGMYLTVCSQRPADISPTILSQMHNYFIHRLVNDEDLRAIAKSVSFIGGASMSMIPVLPQGCCIVSGTAATHPSRVQVERLEREKQPRSYDRDLATRWRL